MDDLEGYAATKLMRAGFRSNNLDPNAASRASAAVTFIRASAWTSRHCYDDFEHADAFVLWGSNMRCTRFWGRAMTAALGAELRIVVLSTYEHRSTDLADIPMIFRPGTDLAISTISPTTSSRPEP